jgi:hypothetical protein
MTSHRPFAASCLAALLAACTSVPAPPPPAESGMTVWHPVLLPGKRATDYALELKDGRLAVAARADRSASLWRRNVRVPPQALGAVEFSWWVQALIPGADVQQAEHADAPARVIFAFTGDSSKLSARNQAMFELARVLTGEEPPYATLMYVWDDKAPVESVIVNARSDRVRKIVVESGPAHLRQWRNYRRDLAADFRRAFGEAPGVLVGIAVMTDADNTQSRAETWYGPITLH